MQRTLIAIALSATLACAPVLAQQQGSGNSAGGPTLTDRAKSAAETAGEKTRNAAETVKDKTRDLTQRAKDGTSDTAAAGRSSGSTDQMQRQADADYKSAKAQCEPMQQRAQRTLCEKQATAAHANAEVEIARARAAAEGGGTASMGAGKSGSRP